MSKRVFGIALFTLAVVIVLAVGIWYFQREARVSPEEQQGTELVETEPADTDILKDTAATDGAAAPLGEGDEGDIADYEFLMVNEDNFVTVYQLPERELYEYTDIIMDVLPEDVRAEIEDGKYLRNEEELYNFLENYTS